MSVALLRQKENASISFCSCRHLKNLRPDTTCQEAHILTFLTSAAGGVMPKCDPTGDVIPVDASRPAVLTECRC